MGCTSSLKSEASPWRELRWIIMSTSLLPDVIEKIGADSVSLQGERWIE